MAGKAVLHARRAKTLELMKAGATLDQVAKQTGVTLLTAWKDFSTVREEFAKYLSKTTPWQRYAELDQMQRARIIRLFKILTSDDSKAHEVIRAANSLQHEQLLIIRMDQLLGILPKDSPSTVVMGENVSMTQNNLEFNNWEKDIARRLACPSLLPYEAGDRRDDGDFLQQGKDVNHLLEKDGLDD
jgi:hypothetical protein